MIQPVLLIGTGSAGSVVAKKILNDPDNFPSVHILGRSGSNWEELRSVSDKFTTHRLDLNAEHAQEKLTSLLCEIRPFLVINMALPYHDLLIMDACLISGSHYLDTANYEPIDEAKFSYKWQWKYQDQFKKAGLMALLGSGFDPGVTNVFCAYANKHLFDEIESIDIVDCNDGDHGRYFATNFNPEINIREITQPSRYWSNGEWIENPSLAISKNIFFPEIGERRSYLLYHEELESLARHIPNVKVIRFWMTFSDHYINCLSVLKNIGLTKIEPILFQGQKIIPLKFLSALLPDPKSLAKNYTGNTCIGCLFTGKKDGQEKKIMIYNICSHEMCYNDFKAQAVGYTTGIPAVIGAKLLMKGIWKQAGVINLEQLNPDPFMEELQNQGLPWKLIEL